MTVESSSGALPHICVCICTYKRPTLLRRLLETIAAQETDNLFSLSVVVVDNDRSRSAEEVVRDCMAALPLNVKYVVEPRQNIARTRNKAVEHADGDFICFIDDDEYPIKRWLVTLFNVCHQHGADGVLGPVKPHFDDPPPQWVVKGKFYERQTYPTGLVIDWRKGRTGNVLLRKRVFAGMDPVFNPELRNGEDQEFFYRAIAKGHVFVWCNEAVAYEEVPPIRWKRTFMLRRALLRGASEPMTPNFGVRDIIKSAVAVPVYVAALPFALLAGQHIFMGLSVRLCDHLGKLLAVAGINPVPEPYVTD